MLGADDPPATAYLPNDPYGKSVGAVHRGLEILELFAVEQTPLTVNDISRKLGYPQSSTSVLLHGLHNLGYLLHDRRARTFYPSVRVAFLGLWMHHRLFNEDSLLQLMESLAQATGHVVLLAIQNGLYAQYMHIVSARPSRVGLKPGLMRPICRAAVGKVLLSMRDDDEILRIARNANAIDSEIAAPLDLDALMDEVRACRASGFAYSREAVTAGSAVVATRLPIDVADSPLAIGIAVHAHEFEACREQIETLLRDGIHHHFNSVAAAAQGRPAGAPVSLGRYAVGKPD
ncbi:IclR family transcriptional regulator [Bordetella sp. LUAb4]|uniref:IclR family transcriptional regulator n=1 Tax=Bordetella sp. LUAb4 TaxID=2843195 RepID=UPI001E60AFC2|nr:helix-turn-helix domain-containing protein [Bordetella sp. LUAb4]